MKETSHYYSKDDLRSATVIKDEKRGFGAICVGYDRRVLRTKDFFEGVDFAHTSYFECLAQAENFAENWVLYQD